MVAWKIKYTSNFPLFIALMPHRHIHRWYQYLSVSRQIIMIFPCQGFLLFWWLIIDIFLLHIVFGSGRVMNKMSINTSLQNKLATLFQKKGAGVLNRVCQRIPRKDAWARLLQEITERLIPMARTEFPWICGTHTIIRKVTGTTWLELRVPIKKDGHPRSQKMSCWHRIQ